MDIKYGTGIGLQNRYEALFSDNSIDPLDAISKIEKKAPKKTKPKKGPNAKAKAKAKSDQEQIQTKEPQALNKTLGKAKKDFDKPTKPPIPAKKPSATVPEKTLEVKFERLLTLVEYREKKTRSAPHYNLRKPGEGEDLSQWENLVPLEKKKHADEEVGAVLETSGFPQRAGRVKRLPVRVTFGDSLVRNTTTLRDVTARLANDNAAAAEPVKRQRPPKLSNKLEFPTLG